MPKKPSRNDSRPPTSEELDERHKMDVDDPEEALRAFLKVDPDAEPVDPTADSEDA
jgi:hypothetical protein